MLEKQGLSMSIKITALLVILILLAPTVYAFQDITGFVPGRYDEKKERIDLVINQSKPLTFTLDVPESSDILSVKLCGKIIGEGSASAFLITDGKRMKIIEHNTNKKSFINIITGLFFGMANSLTGSTTLDTNSNETSEIRFQECCLDTCHMNLKDKNQIQIEFYVDEGTTMEISHLGYYYKLTSYEDPTLIGRIITKILNIFR